MTVCNSLAELKAGRRFRLFKKTRAARLEISYGSRGANIWGIDMDAHLLCFM